MSSTYRAATDAAQLQHVRLEGRPVVLTSSSHPALTVVADVSELVAVLVTLRGRGQCALVVTDGDVQSLVSQMVAHDVAAAALPVERPGEEHAWLMAQLTSAELTALVLTPGATGSWVAPSTCTAVLAVASEGLGAHSPAVDEALTHLREGATRH